jgi:5-methylcytosine-specific restriction endonuclease McrA
MKRSRLNPRSAKSKAADAEHDLVREAVFARDGYRCLLAGRRDVPPCAGYLTPHHLAKASQGGAYVKEGLVTLCSFHNGWVEDHPNLAHEKGLVCRAGDTLLLCWARMRAAGLVRS